MTCDESILKRAFSLDELPEPDLETQPYWKFLRDNPEAGISADAARLDAPPQFPPPAPTIPNGFGYWSGG